MSNNGVSDVLIYTLAGLSVLFFILIVIYIVVYLKTKNDEKIIEEKITSNDLKTKTKTKTKKEKGQVSYNKQSIFSFLEFDKIEDNMIVRKNGNKYVMVIECQGINYDLMSGLEKNGVEQGFLQFLNTIRYPIQIYIQTRTVNLESGLIKYKERLKAIRDRLAKKQLEYAKKEGLGYNEKELEKAKLEVTRERNLYEYGLDIINSTERMSLNRNILKKHYYVIIDYSPEDITTINNLGKEEISNMAFEELYTKAQNIINALSVCGVNGKVLDSIELSELLYVAYNRDEAEVYDLDKAMRAGYEEMYMTAPNVLEKRMKEIEKKIEEDAVNLANEMVMEAMEEREEEKRVREKEEEMDALISKMAKIIIRDNQELVGVDLASKAEEKIDKRNKTKKQKEAKDEKK